MRDRFNAHFPPPQPEYSAAERAKWAEIMLSLKLTNGSFLESYNSDIEQYYFTEKYCKPYFRSPKLCIPCLSLHSLATIDKMDSAEVY